MNKFLLASFGLAVMASGLAFGSGFKPGNEQTETPQAAPVDLVALEARLQEFSVSYAELSNMTLAQKQERLAQEQQRLAQNPKADQVETEKSVWTKGKVAAVVATGLVATGALVAAAYQKGYMPKSLQPYCDRVAGSSLASGISSRLNVASSAVSSACTTVGTKASALGSSVANSWLGSKASGLGSSLGGYFTSAKSSVANSWLGSKASGLGSSVRGWFTKATPMVPVDVTPTVPVAVVPSAASYVDSSWAQDWATMA